LADGAGDGDVIGSGSSSGMLTISARVEGGAATGDGTGGKATGGSVAGGTLTGGGVVTAAGRGEGLGAGSEGNSGGSTPTRPHHPRTSSPMRDRLASATARRQNCQSEGCSPK
jgi:hypothetical protein